MVTQVIIGIVMATLMSMAHAAVIPLDIVLSGDREMNYPRMGVYKGGEGYRQNPVFIQAKLPAKNLTLPATLKKSLGKIDTVYFIIAGIQPKEREYNIIFHEVVRAWLPASKRWHDFDEYIQAGIFEPNGVAVKRVEVPDVEGQLGSNSLGRFEVEIHLGGSYSPNNGIFTLNTNRKIASFWVAGARTAGSSQNVVALYIIIVDELVKTLFESWVGPLVPPLVSVQSKKRTPSDDQDNLEKLKKELEVLKTEGDIAGDNLTALSSALNILNQIPIVRPVDTGIVSALKRCAHELELLQSKIIV